MFVVEIVDHQLCGSCVLLVWWYGKGGSDRRSVRGGLGVGWYDECTRWIPRIIVMLVNR